MRGRGALRLALGAVVLAGGVLTGACGPPCDTDGDCPEGTGCKEGSCARECGRDTDCPLGQDCGVNHLCGPPAAGDITWLSPAPNSTVPSRFDAELEVGFRAASAVLRVTRGEDPGDPCAPFVPFERVLEGDAAQYLTRRVTVPGLLALGERFSLSATLQAAGGGSVSGLSLSGPASGTGGARITQPEERSFDADGALTLPVSAELERAAARVAVHVEPLDGVAGAERAVGAGLDSFAGFPVLLARGPQVLWVSADDARCGRGLEGVGQSDPGLELGLRYSAEVPAQLGLRLLMQSDVGTGACGFADPGELCQPLRESAAPTTVGEQLLVVPMTEGTVQIAVVPGAASGYVTAEIRVSLHGQHLGWLGPFPIDTSAGQAWIAGQVLVGAGGPQLLRTDEVTTGAPW